MAVLCLSLAPMKAQVQFKVNLPQKENTNVSPIFREKIDSYATQINAIIQEQKAKMEIEIKDVNAKLENNSISKETADQEKAKIADKYSEIIDTKINDLGFDIDDVVGKQVRYSLLNEDANSEQELKEKLIKRYKAARSITTYMSYGAMALTDVEENSNLDLHKSFSNNFEIGFKLNYQLSQTSPWAIVSGLGFSWRTLRLNDDYYFSHNNNTEPIITQYGKNLDRSKLRTGYIMVPLGLQYNFSKVKTVAGDIQYRPYYNGVKLGANVYGGVRMATNNIVKGDGVKYRNKENYDVNPFVYGAQITLGYNDWSLFVKKDFSNYFDNNYFNKTKMLQFGISYNL